MGFDGHVGLIGDFMGLFFWNLMDFAGGLMGFNGFCFFLVMIFHGGSIVDFIGFNGDTVPFIIYIFCVPATGTRHRQKKYILNTI